MSKSPDVTQMEAFVVGLKFEERMMLSNILLRSEGNAAMLGLVRKFRAELSVDEDEQKAMGVFFTPDGRVGWDTDADKPVEFRVGPALRGLIVTLLKHADAAEGLTYSQLSLFEKFVGEVEETEDADA